MHAAPDDAGPAPTSDAALQESAPADAAGHRFFDDFARADGDVGPNWWLSGPGRFEIRAGSLRYIQIEPDGGTGCGAALATWHQSFAPRQELHVRIAARPNYGNWELRTRVKGRSWVAAALQFAPTAVKIEVVSESVSTSLGESVPLEVRAEDTFGLRWPEAGRVELVLNDKVVAERSLPSGTPTGEGGQVAIYAACASNEAGTAFAEVWGGEVR